MRVREVPELAIQLRVSAKNNRIRAAMRDSYVSFKTVQCIVTCRVRKIFAHNIHNQNSKACCVACDELRE
jgi:hypothetical protein